MIFVRVHARRDIGIGHLIRMTHLARELVEQGNEVRFVIDVEHPGIDKYLFDFAVDYLYSEEHLETLDQLHDAVLFARLLKNFPVDMVIVDSYLLGVEWENVIVSNGYKLTVIDDLGNRRHNCDYLVDQKWCGPIVTQKRYEELVPDTCQRLLGPAYCMLAPQYRYKKIVSDPVKFTVMFSLGGGGNLSVIADLITELLQNPELDIRLLPILGPLSTNKDKIIAIAARDPRVHPVNSPDSLYDYYLETSLYVGALGTSLYELAALSIPALSFACAANQENNIVDLEDMGHYFHLGQNELKDIHAVAKLILTFKENIDRLQKTRSNPAIVIDGLGAKRIAEAIMQHQVPANFSILLQEFPKKNFNESDYQTITENISVRKVVDTDVNHYLNARNLQQNSQNMVVGGIMVKDHYKWWFSNHRESYLVEKSGVKKLYIWHQPVRYEQNDYLIGGWFVCDNDSILFDIVTAALKWQLELTSTLFPNTSWVAVIKKTNKFVNLLNQYMGFKSVSESDKEFKAIKFFFNADPLEFNYVKQTPSRDNV